MPCLPWIVRFLWLIPALPAAAGGVGALLPREKRRSAASLAIGAIGLSLLLALDALLCAISNPVRLFVNFRWMQFGGEWIKLGWLLDPLSAVMLAMVSSISLLVFIYSVGYMREDRNFTRFFCFLSLFAGAMLGLVISNSLLALFMCWEVVGLTSYLLIGFWFERPTAAAAAKKAFITTRIGDLGLLLGMVWLYAQTGSLLFYDHGAGSIEHAALAALVSHTAGWGMTVATAISLLIFLGAVGKSGQFPLHVWLPDAMEGPTPVSALIHAATMVAAGVYLVARVYPLMSGSPSHSPAAALQVVAWVGAFTALFAALIAVAQNDIKRVLAYSTISQLGYMMIGLGVGGVAIGMFHLLTHAFFKALLFLGAGSVIHANMHEQDIRKMGGIRKWMPVTFATYAIGTLALCGFPLFFSGFWSKDAILASAHGWSASRGPFYLGAAGALLTAFYMTRQVCYVFFGHSRAQTAVDHDAHSQESGHATHADWRPRESPASLTAPLAVLAIFALLLGFAGTPAWPWLQSFLDMRHAEFTYRSFVEREFLALLLTSSILVFAGLGIGWWIYGAHPPSSAADPDPIETAQPAIFRTLQNAFYVDTFYAATVIRFAKWTAAAASWLDRWVWSGIPRALSWAAIGLGKADALLDRRAINGGFDEGCRGVTLGGRLFSRAQAGRVQGYLRALGFAFVLLIVFLLWGHRG